MDYLYINGIIRETYLDMQCVCAFPEVYANNLYKYIANDDFLKNPDIDNVMTYFSIKTQGKAPMLVLANVERQKTCQSVGRAMQCLGWMWHENLINADMDKIFGAGFYTENEYVAMALENTPIPLPSRNREKAEDYGIEMSPKVRKAIMTAVFMRWLRHDSPIRIAVPGGVDYNAYVWQAVEKIYALFPAALRLEAGFCSYMPDLSKASGRVYLGFVPEEMADSRTIFLDGSRQSAIAAMEKGTQRKNLDQFIDYLCRVDNQTRQNFLAEVYEDLEGAGEANKIQSVNPKDYQAFGEAAALLMQEGTLEQMIPLWEAFYQNPNKHTPRMQVLLADKIRNQLKPEEFCKWLHDACADKKELSDIVDVFSSYEKFYADNSPLAEAVWNEMLSVFQETGANNRNIYIAVYTGREKLNSLLTDQRLDELYRLSMLEQLAALRKKKTETAEEVTQQQATVQQISENIAGKTESSYVADLLAEYQKYQDELNDKQNDFTCLKLRGEYEKLLEKPADKLVQIQKVIRSGEELIGTIDQAPATQKIADLKQEVLTYIAQLKEKINSSATKYAHIQGLIHSGKCYFAVLEDLQLADRASLEPEQLKEMGEELESIRPKSVEDYEVQFEDYYHNRLTLRAISKLADFVCRTVVQDICSFSTVYAPYTGSRNAVDNLEEIAGAEYAAKRISDDHIAKVRFQDMEWDGLWFRQMLRLTHTKKTMGDRDVFEQVFFALADSDAYNGAELLKCIQMFDACGLGFEELFKRIMAGKFSGCTEEQYLCAFEMIVDFSDERRPGDVLQKMQNICKEIDKTDSVAGKAFNKFLDKNRQEPAGKQPKTLLIALIGVSAVALILLVALIISLVSGRQEGGIPEETTIPTQQTMPTETQSPQITYSPLHQLIVRDGRAAEDLFGAASAAGFDGYADKVAACLKNLDEEQAQRVADCYLSDDKPVVIDDNDTQAAWDEFFFWVCWHYANAAETDPDLEFSVEEYRDEACAALRVIYQTMPELPEEEIQEDRTESVTEPATEPENTEETTVPETDAAPATTEPAEEPTGEDVPETTAAPDMPALDEIMETVCAAAKGNYEAAYENAYELQLMLALFGPDFTRDFAEHRKTVEALLSAGDDRAAELLKRYQGLPGDTEILFMDNGVSVTWNEYMFWECWVLAGLDAEPDAGERSLNSMVLDVLHLIHELPRVDEDVTVPAETTAPTEAGDSTEETQTTAPEKQDLLEQMGFLNAADEAQVYFAFAQSAYQAVMRGIQNN